jgi:WhiB family transcriptional regulator, redox-sensing transcriptional regulator
MSIPVATDRGFLAWMREGACLDEDPELFFPVGEGVVGAEQAEEAMAICRRCGVEAECLRFALINGVKNGIWGGRTEQERMAMLRNRRRDRPRRHSQRELNGRPGR